MKDYPMFKNKPVIIFVSLFTIAMLIISFMACYFSFHQKKEEILSSVNMALTSFVYEYQDITNEYAQVYLPIFEDKERIYPSIYNYFATSRAQDLTPFEKQSLVQALSQMTSRGNNVEWIALYSDMREVNYMHTAGQSTPQVIGDDFPYLHEIHTKSSRMEIFGASKRVGGGGIETFVICGNSPEQMGDGKILVGLNTDKLERVNENNRIPELTSLRYLILSDEHVVYDSSGTYETDYSSALLSASQSGVIEVVDGKKQYVSTAFKEVRLTKMLCTIEWQELFLAAHVNTPGIILVVLAFTLLSALIALFIIKMISREVKVIQHGLDMIGSDHLDYRISTSFEQSSFQDIAFSINHMASQLEENINRAYHFELKRREAELSELQAKFNPHFLYNSLDIIRAKCHQNGDSETAELTTQLAAIFRGFVGSRTFITIQEELAFSKRYLSMYRARYGERVRILYDFEPEVLGYGIIRNTFQPLIENYFSHGFNTAQGDNFIRFSGRIQDEHTILLTVEDNGIGICAENLRRLNSTLSEPILMDQESYGLKNLHQRLYLFYGSDCGLTIKANHDRGITIDIIMRRMIPSDGMPWGIGNEQ